jgi:hypothetical protein
VAPSPAENSTPLNASAASASEGCNGYEWAFHHTWPPAAALKRKLPPGLLATPDLRTLHIILEAAKIFILQLMTEDTRKKLDLDSCGVGYTGMKKIAREMEIIIPAVHYPMAPNISRMDRIVRAATAYIAHLQRTPSAPSAHTVQPKSQTDQGGPLVAGLTIEDAAAMIEAKRQKKWRQKERRRQAKLEAQAAEKAEVAPKPETAPPKEVSKKRKRDSQHNSDEAVPTIASGKKSRREVAPPVEEGSSNSDSDQSQLRNTRNHTRKSTPSEEESSDSAPDEPRSKRTRRSKKDPTPNQPDVEATQSIRPKPKKSNKNKKTAPVAEDDVSKPEVDEAQPAKAKKANKAAPHIEEDLSDSEPNLSRPRQTKKAKKAAPRTEKVEIDTELDVSQPKKTKKSKKAVALIKGNIPVPVLDKRKKQTKHTSVLEEDITPVPTAEKSKKIGKKHIAADPDEMSDIDLPSPKPNKRKKTRTSILLAEDSPSILGPAPTFEFDTSYLNETLETTEQENSRLKEEVRGLRSIVQAFGVSNVHVSVALTRMRHRQSAQDIFSGAGVKREEQDD